MPKTPDDLFAFLADAGITVSTKQHPPLYTVAELQETVSYTNLDV